VDYQVQLELSRYRDQVAAAYLDAGLDLEGDLKRLAAAPRISADRGAAGYLNRNVTLSGRLRSPLLSVHGTNDPQVPVESEQAYAQAVGRWGRPELLRNLFVGRPGHCAMAESELLACLQVLLERLDSGRWALLEPAEMNRRAALLGGGPAAFARYSPGPFPRPYPPI
jgi:hypothetical protein